MRVFRTLASYRVVRLESVPFWALSLAVLIQDRGEMCYDDLDSRIY
jgi:hypothetical protein